MRIALGLAVALAWLALAGGARADDWPSRPIRLIVTFPAGGPSDLLARAVGQKLADSVKQSVVVDNRPGASGLIGNEIVAKAAPDGYTLGLPSAGSMAIVPNLTKLPYDRDKDLQPITTVARVPQVLVVNPKRAPVADLRGLLALAKARPGQLSFGSTGNGSPTHLILERLKQLAGVDILHVPYKGAAPSLTDILGGQIDLIASDPPPVLPHLKAGTLRALAISDGTRLAMLPDTPTFAEAGLPGLVMVNWYVLVGPHGMTAALLARLHDAVAGVLADPELVTRLAAQGMTLASSTPADTAAFIQAESRVWGEVARAANVRLDD